MEGPLDKDVPVKSKCQEGEMRQRTYEKDTDWRFTVGDLMGWKDMNQI